MHDWKPKNFIELNEKSWFLVKFSVFNSERHLWFKWSLWKKNDWMNWTDWRPRSEWIQYTVNLAGAIYQNTVYLMAEPNPLRLRCAVSHCSSTHSLNVHTTQNPLHVIWLFPNFLASSKWNLFLWHSLLSTNTMNTHTNTWYAKRDRCTLSILYLFYLRFSFHFDRIYKFKKRHKESAGEVESGGQSDREREQKWFYT